MNVSGQEQGDRSNLRTAAIVVYGTLIFMIFAVPQSISNWVNDIDSTPVRTILLPVTETI
jgi:hypothetical protein